MFTPERMHQINVLVFETDVDEVAKAIVRLGILHLIRLDDQEPWAESLMGYEAGEVRGRIGYLRSRIAALMKNLEMEQVTLAASEDRIAEVSPTDLAAMEKNIASIESSLEGHLARRRDLRLRLERMLGIANEIAPLLSIGLTSVKAPYTFLEMHYGEILSENMEILREKIGPLAAVALTLGHKGKKEVVLVIGLKSDRLKMKRILREAAFDEIEVSEEARKESTGVSKELGKKIEELKADVAAVGSEIQTIRDRHETTIAEYYRSLQVASLLLKVKNYLKRTRKTFIFSGWIPAANRRLVENEILRAAKGRAIIEVFSPEEIAGVKSGKIKVPVLLKHPGFFRPFEMIVSSFGLPEYKVIDPTVFVAITFLLMFGVMFGDVGHGAVLAAIGALLGFRSRDANGSTALVGKLAFYSGLSSIVFGFLFGSVFGLEELIPHLWIKPMSNIMYFFKVTVYFGIAIITLGITFNIINAIRLRDLKAGVFDHAGILAAVMYWCGIGIVAFFLKSEPIPIRLLVFGIAIPVFLFFLKEPLIALIKHHRPVFDKGVGMYLIETTIEVFEVIMGYLANTVSFIRVAAFSLAHVGLFSAVFSLVAMVKDKEGGVIYSALILVVGNIGIIALEGLVVAIQAIRLEYYEFFGKFFFGSGVAYKPIGLGGKPGPED